MPEDKAMTLQETQFNGDAYLMRMFFGRVLSDGKSLDPSKTLYVNEDNIASITFNDDIMQPLPRFKMMIKDPRGEKLMDFPPDGKTIFFFLLKHFTVNKQDNGSPAGPTTSETVTHAFIVDEIDVSDMTNDEVYTRVSGVSIHMPLWRSSLSYSWAGSGGGVSKSATKIVEEIMQQAELPIVPAQPNTHSSHKAIFISPVNSRVGENVSYLLEHGCTDSDGVYFMPFDWSYEWPQGSKFGSMTGKFELLSMRNIAQQDPLPFNAIKIPTYQGYFDVSGLARNIESNSHITASRLMDFNSNVNLSDFSHIQREWTTDKYDADRLARFFSPMKFEDSLEPQIGRQLQMFSTKKAKMSYEKQPKIECFMGGRMREFSRLAGDLRFTSTGFIKRAPGQLFKVFVDNPITALYKKLTGVYVISRISHHFKKGIFEQEFDLVRPDRISEVANAILNEGDR